MKEKDGGYVMDVLDLVIVASMGVLAVIFAAVVMREWWDARTERRRAVQRYDARIIQHRHSDSRIFPAA